MNKKRNIVILLGGPGAGKGTQAAEIAARFKIPHISTGELLRSEAASGSALGLRVKTVMNAGELVDDQTVNELIAQRVRRQDCERGFILDGYPRSVDQAVALKRLLSAADRMMALDIDVDPEKIIPRLTGRRTCSSCRAIYHVVAAPPRNEGICDRCGGALTQRSDDREDVIRERFKAYFKLTKPLTALFDQWGVYRRVDGMQSADAVAKAIQELLADEFLRKETVAFAA